MKTFVMITTEWRGVFAGFLVRDDEDKRVVELEQVRCAIDWETTGGFLELAEVGPSKRSRIGNTAPAAKIQGVTGIWHCTNAAMEAWTNHGK